MSQKSTSSVKKVLINLFDFLHILVSFGHKLRKEVTLFFVNLVKLASKFRDGVKEIDEMIAIVDKNGDGKISFSEFRYFSN